MRLPIHRFIVPTAIFGVLGLVGALIWLASVAPAHAQVPSHYFKGEVFVDGRPAEDGTRVRAFVDNVRVGETKTKDGVIVLGVPQTLGEKFRGKVVEFRGIAPDGRQFTFLQTSIWQAGGETRVKLSFGGGTFDNRRPEEPFKISGKILMGGRLAPDGTRIEAFVDGFSVGESRTRGGAFDLFLNPPPPPQPPPDGKLVEFGGTTPDGKHFDFHETVIWRPGDHVNLAFEVPGFQTAPVFPVRRLPDGIDVQCIFKVLGRIPSSTEDMSPRETLRVAQNCLSGREEPPDIEAERDRLKREEAFRVEQERLDQARLRQEQERIKQQRDLQAQQNRLEQDRLKSERARQGEQARLDRDRLQQEQQRFKEEEELRLEQQRLDRRRANQDQKRQEELETARFQSERERIARERTLDEERIQGERERLDREFSQQEERLRREVDLNIRRQELEEERQRIIQAGGQPPPLPPVEDEQQPMDEKPVKKAPTRGFFSNSTVGGLGTANNLMDPTKLAILGILLTLGATVMQMIKGS